MVKRFSDFAKAPDVLDGDKIKLDDLINQDVVVIGYKVTDSKYSKNKLC